MSFIRKVGKSMKIYYVKVWQRIEHTFVDIEKYYYFESEYAQKDWIRWFKDQHYSLQKILEKGQCYFDKEGILCPYTA